MSEMRARFIWNSDFRTLVANCLLARFCCWYQLYLHGELGNRDHLTAKLLYILLILPDADIERTLHILRAHYYYCYNSNRQTNMQFICSIILLFIWHEDSGD